MVEWLDFSDIESVVFEMIDYREKPNGSAFADGGLRSLLNKVAELEASIKTHNEFKEGRYIPEEHTPMRLAVFLLNYYGEYALNGRTITICGDDPDAGQTFAKAPPHTHDNTYILSLKDEATHKRLFSGNPSADSAPYDFDASFLRQETFFNNGVRKDTTATAWDSFAFRHGASGVASGYRPPQRMLDFKSALWNWKNWGNAHGVDYVVSIDESLNVSVRSSSGSMKEIKLSQATAKQETALVMYGVLLRHMRCLKNLNWDNFKEVME